MRPSLLKILFLGPLVFIPVWLAALGFEQLSQRHVTYRYIADALDPISVTPTNVEWLTPKEPLDRPITPADADRLGLALTEAWQALAAAQASGDANILKDRFTGVALDRAQMSVDHATLHGGRISVLAQSARPLFFHMDGSLLQLELRLLTARYVKADAGLPFHQMTWDTAVVTLKNQTSGWRIFSYERRTAEPAGQGRAPWAADKLLGVNYYPKDTPWRAFWDGFDADVAAQDFDRIRNLGGNTIRVFLTYEEFADPDVAGENLPKLKALLQLADENNIHVIPTLFDLKPSYGPGSWATDFIYLRNVLTVLKDAPAVAFIDLKNEADLDFTAHDPSDVHAWLRTMIGAVRELAPEVSVTIGWAKSDATGNLTDVLDVVSYHEFGPRTDTAKGFALARDAAGDLPVVITEIGASSFDVALGFPGSEEAQAKILQDRLGALAEADGVLVWTLFDFPKVDGSVIGLSPWRKRLQAAYGLFRADGSEKPAARAVRQAFTTSQNP